jgi:drug/metabolite transporter (DMT)-like permease
MIVSPIWLPATLVGGGLQAWRTAVQRRVGKSLSVNAAGLVRYLYGLPFAGVLLLVYAAITVEGPWPQASALYLPVCLAGGVAQIVATNLLLMAFAHRNFVVGTAYAKTEAVQGALLSLLLLGERLSPLSWSGIASGVAGVMLLSTAGRGGGPRALAEALSQPAARFGIASGFFFALTAIGIRAATGEVATGDRILAALMVLATTVAAQTVLQGGYLLLREPAQMAQVFRQWRIAGQVGLLSSVGSACWFTGFATAPVALVRIVGQVEIGFTMAFGHFYLNERISRTEAAGLVLVSVGVVLALLGAR